MQPETKTSTDMPTHWPPIAHIVRREDGPPVEGSIALCGARLMGVDLRDDVRKTTCERCREIMTEELKSRFDARP